MFEGPEIEKLDVELEELEWRELWKTTLMPWCLTILMVQVVQSSAKDTHHI